MNKLSHTWLVVREYPDVNISKVVASYADKRKAELKARQIRSDFKSYRSFYKVCVISRHNYSGDI